MRIAQSIHNFLQAFTPLTRGAVERGRDSVINSPRVQPTVLWVRSPLGVRVLAEIERKRNQAYLYSLKNQIR
jgi:hypothetical protein